MVEVFFKGTRIASHRRLYGRPSQYSTVIEHMPEKHRHDAEWNSERFIKWASGIGPNTEKAICAIIASRNVEQQSYKTCIAILKLADSCSVARLEAACTKALAYRAVPSFRSLRTILLTGSDRKIPATVPEDETASHVYALTRGAAYYGGNGVSGGTNDDK